MRNLRTLAAFAALLLLNPAARAADWVIKQSTYYLTAEEQAFPAFPPPPAAGSAADRADLKAVMDWQRRRTPAQCEEAVSQRYAGFGDFFGGISPFPDPLPEEAAAILARVGDETDWIVYGLKERFKRPRPFLRDPALQPCGGRAGGLAYPSGHSTIAHVYALLLSDLAPKRRAEFMARADKAALNRVIGGVHHPADIEAGARLAGEIYAKLKTSRPFKTDLKTLKGLLAKPAAAAKAGR